MLRRLPREAIDQTTRCSRGLACLNDHGQPRCEVEYAVNAEVMFVRCLSSLYCNYQIPFGDGNACSCPVRIALGKLEGK